MSVSTQTGHGGIYQIINLTTGDRYVGSTINLKSRFGQHRKTLRSGKHHCKLLQAAWIKYGEQEFSFTIIEVVDNPTWDKLITREQAAMDRLRPFYNTVPVAGSRPGIQHLEHSRAKMRVAWKRNWDGTPAFAEREVKRIAALTSSEVVAKLSAARKLIPRTDEWRAKQSQALQGNQNSAGAIASEEKREKMSAGMKAAWDSYTPEQRAARIAASTPDPSSKSSKNAESARQQHARMTEGERAARDEMLRANSLKLADERRGKPQFKTPEQLAAARENLESYNAAVTDEEKAERGRRIAAGHAAAKAKNPITKCGVCGTEKVRGTNCKPCSNARVAKFKAARKQKQAS